MSASFGAPASLVQSAIEREDQRLRDELVQTCRQLERNIRHTLKVIEASKLADPQWLAAARLDLNKGAMCLVRAVTRADFF